MHKTISNSKVPSVRYRVDRILDFWVLYLYFFYVLLTYSMLYEYSAMRYCYEMKEILFAISLAVILVNCLSFVLAAISYGFEMFFNSIFLRIKKINLYPAVSFIVLLLSVYVILTYGILYAKSFSCFNFLLDFILSLHFVFKVTFRVVTIFAASLAVVVLFRKKKTDRFNKLPRGFKGYAALSLLFAIIIAVVMSFVVKHAPYSKDRPIGIMPSSQQERPNVILLICDALGASDMSLYGYSLQTTPNIDNFAKESFVFDNMYSSSTSTASSWPSLFDGTYQSVHKRFYSYYAFEPKHSERDLFYILSSAGYAVCYAGDDRNIPLDSSKSSQSIFGQIKFRYKIPLHAWLKRIFARDFRLPINLILHYLKRFKSAPELNEISILDTVLAEAERAIMAAKRPFFLYVYSSYCHGPYYIPLSFQGKFLSGNQYLYNIDSQVPNGIYPAYWQDKVDKMRLIHDEGILYLDYKLGSFIQFLRDGDILDNSIVIITADHGQSFHSGFFGHGGPILSEEMLHLPLIIHLPNQAKGERIKVLASHVDVAPTIMELCGIKGPAPWMQGESLVPYMKNSNLLTDKPKFAMWLKIIGEVIKGGIVAVYKDNYKLVSYSPEYNKSPELYNLTNDPYEKNDISRQKEELVLRLNNLARDIVTTK